MCEIGEFLVAVLLMLIAYKDWKEKKISCLALIVLFIVIAGLRLTVVKDVWWSTLGGVVPGLLFFLVSKCSRESIGYGDSWLILLLGIFVGIKTLLEMIVIALFLTALFSVGYCIKYGFKKTHTIPFAPFLAIAYMGVMFL